MRCFDVGFPRPGHFQRVRTIVTTGESPTQTQTITRSIPANATRLKVTANTGTCSFKRSGKNLSITGSGGNVVDEYFDTKTVTVTVGPQSSSSFPSTYAYNSDGYTGTLDAGTPYVVSGTSQPCTLTMGPQSSTSFPATYSYSDENGFSGTLYAGAPYENVVGSGEWYCDFTGDISNQRWDCDYTGSVYTPTIFYYQYTFTITYACVKYPSFPVYPTKYDYFSRPF